MTNVFYIILIGLLGFIRLSAAQPASISGFVTDSSNGAGLYGANVYLQDLPVGSASNHQGYFVLYPVPTGTHQLIVSYLGYRSRTIPLTLQPGENYFIQIELSPEVLPGEEVVVSAAALTREKEIRISQIDLSTRTIRSAPQLGEADLFRTLQALPGVVAPSDYSTGLVVRGGNTDQNLIMLDGITVYNPSHLGGLFSNFLLDAIKDARFIKGGFPAEYGGRMSAVLNMISKTGNSKKASGSAGVSLLSSRLCLEMPVGNGSVLLAGRRTYFDQVLKLMNKEFPYYFYDLQGNAYQDVSPYDRVMISGYLGDDVLSWEKLNFDLSWGNRTGSLHWRHIFSPRVFANFMLAASSFRTRAKLGGDHGINSHSRLTDYTLKGDLDFLYSSENSFKTGIEIKSLVFDYENNLDDRNLFRLRRTPLGMAVYVQEEWRPTSRWILKPGLRLSYFSDADPVFYLEPRFSLKYRLRPGEYLTAASGIYRQFIFTVQDEYNPSLINNWFSVDQSVPVGKSVHYILGYERELWSTTRIQVEIYYKSLNNMLTYREQRSSPDEPLGEEIKNIDFFIPNDGKSYGMEIFIHKQYGRLAGWLGYTLNWARKKLEGDTYYASFDRRHNLNLVASYDIGKRWRAGLRFNYGSGFPYTRVAGSYEEYDAGLMQRRLIYGPRNRFRYPAYHRLDISLSKNFGWFNLDWQFDLQVVNVYNRKNVFLYEWDFEENPAERTVIPMLPLIPTLGVSVRF